MLEENEFLIGESCTELRTELYTLYCETLVYLKKLNSNIDITTVQIGEPTYCHSGKICIPVKPDDKGVLFHEMGHALLANSKFHSNYLSSNRNKNEQWGEAFAEAIRWLMEKKHFKCSKWMSDFEQDKLQVGSNKYKAAQIIEKSQRCLDGFKTLWENLVREFDKSENYLDRKLLGT